MNPESFLPLVTGALGGALTNGIFAGPIKTLEDWWFVTYGHKWAEQSAIIKAKIEVNVEELKTSTLIKVTEIEPQNIQEPKIKILGPTLEASKYYLEEEELRDMFASLIAASMDSSKNDIIHSSYVEIIKQLSPLESKILQHLHPYSLGNAVLPIVNINRDILNDRMDTPYKNVFLGIPNTDIKLVSASLDNLVRLGLVSIDYLKQMHEKDLYKPFYELEEYLSLEHDIELEAKRNDEWNKLDNMMEINTSEKHVPIFNSVYLQEGVIELTDFGQNFCRTVL